MTLLVVLGLISWSLPAQAQYVQSTIFANSGPMTGYFTPQFQIDPSSGRPYADYALNINAPGSYTIDLISSSSSAYDPYLVLYQNGMQLESNDDGGGYPNSQITRFLAPGTYVVRVSSFRRGPVSVPTAFTLSVSGGGGGGFVPAGYGTPPGGQMLMIGSPISGIFLPSFPVNPVDSRPYMDYTINIQYPGNYQIDLFSANASGYDPYLVLLQYGTEIDRNDDGGGYPNSRISRFLGPGVYTVRVSSFRHGPISIPTAFTLTTVQR